MATRRPEARARPRGAVYIALPPELLHELEEACEVRAIGRSKMVERFVRQGLRRLPPLPEEDD